MIDTVSYQNRLVQKNERNYSLDILKFLASVAVVAIHVESNYRIGEFVPNTELWDISLIINLLSKWSVPVFFMCSGYFLLNDKKNYTYKEFLSKRIFKVLIPFLATPIIYNVYYQYSMGGVSIKGVLLNLAKHLLGYPSAVHLWFLYPLIGLYIFTPLLKGLLDKLDGKLVILAIISCTLVKTIIPFTDIVAQWQANYWRELPLFINAPTIYFILGGYLGRVELNKPMKISLYIVNIIIFCISVFLSFKIDFLYSRNLEVLLDISAINNLLMSLSLFIFFKDMKLKNLKESKLFRNIVKTLSDVNFGVFLWHPIFINIIKPYFVGGNKILMDIIVQIAAVYFITSVVVYIIKKIPIIRRIA